MTLIHVDVIRRKITIPGVRPQRWWVLITNADNNTDLFKSTESYTNEQDAISAAWQALATGQADVYLRQTAWQVGNQLMRLANDVDLSAFGVIDGKRQYVTPLAALRQGQVMKPDTDDDGELGDGD